MCGVGGRRNPCALALANRLPRRYAGRHPPFTQILDGEHSSPRALVRRAARDVVFSRGYHIDNHWSKPVQPIFSTQPRGSLRAVLRCASRSALTVLVVTAIPGCTPGGGGVSPSAPPIPEGQAILGWGGNSSGQLGDGSINQRLNPVTVPQRDLRAIAAGGDGSLGLTVDGRVLEWGWGRSSPGEVTGLSGVKAIAAGERHRLALTNDGKVWAWGENDRGQLGDGTTTPRATPVQVVGLTDVLSIAAGARHSLAIGKGFAVMAWGADDAGQLGDGKTTDSPTPVTVPGRHRHRPGCGREALGGPDDRRQGVRMGEQRGVPARHRPAEQSLRSDQLLVPSLPHRAGGAGGIRRRGDRPSRRPIPPPWW